MPGLGSAGLVALLFGTGAYYATNTLGWFSTANFVVAAIALAVSAARAIVRARGSGASPAQRRVLVRGLATIAAVVVAGVLLERAAARTGLQWDWSFEGKFELSPAVLEALADLAPVRCTLYTEDFDPRLRGTRILLRTMEATGHIRCDERRLEDSPEDEDAYAIGTSNTLVFFADDRFETVERPTEGSIYEALFRLRPLDSGVVYWSRGSGEGDLRSTADVGYSGFAESLITEGYEVRELVTAAAEEIPEDADLLIVAGARRPLRPEAVAAIERYLMRGGRLVAFLEPGVESGLEPMLERWGFGSPDAWVIDPASGPVEGDPPGLNPLIFRYAKHPLTSGLDESRFTFFRGTRAFELRKPEPDDKMKGVAHASQRSWLLPAQGARRPTADETSPRPLDAREDYHAVVASGKYQRGDAQARIVAFGDADLASNHYARALYNQDLLLNAVHWATAQDPRITIRPKNAIAGRLQLPLPLQNTLTMFQSVGLLLPELLLIAGAVAWARSRSA